MANKTPSLKFKDYSNKWTDNTLGGLGSVAMCKRVFKHQTSPQGDIPFFKIGTFGGMPDAYISRELFEDYKSKYAYPNTGDILLSASGSIGKTVVYNGNDEYFQDSNIVWLKHSKNEIINPFLHHFYSLAEWEGLEGSTIKRLYNEIILKTKISYPSIPEQKRISGVLDDLDSIIKLYQTKTESIINLKKSLLNSLFPNMSETAPKIRFKEFSKDWRLLSYQNIGEPLSGGNLSYNDLAEDGKLKCVLYGELYTLYDSVIEKIVNKTNKKATTIRRNDILFPQSTTVDALSLISPACMNDDEAQTAGVFVIRPNEDIDGNFISYYTKGNTDQKYKLSKKAQGLTIIHLYYQSIQDETIFVPELKEQKKISSLFKSIDGLISLYQNKVVLLQNMKSSLLSKMFPN